MASHVLSDHSTAQNGLTAPHQEGKLLSLVQIPFNQSELS